jgi:hypothetical protein
MSKTTKTTRKSSKNATVENQFNMQAAHEAEISLTDDALLASMLDDIIEVESKDEVLADSEHTVIEAAVAEIEKAEAVQALYAEDDAPEVEAAQPDADKPKKEKKAKAPKAPKEPKAPRVTYVGHKASEVLSAKLGEKANEMLLLEVADAALEPSALEAKQAELLALLNKRPGTGEGGSTQKKVAEKIVMLFSWMKSGGKLNEVMERTFRVLARDGEIISGDKGNLHAELLAKPYSVGTARAQAGQMMAMLPMLKIANKTEKGKLEVNPDSLLFMKAKAELGLG